MKLDGIKVVDAKRELTIRVTPLDAKRGATKDPSSCAAARACIRDAHCTQARVHLGRTYLLVNGKWVRYRTPASVRSEIIAFDRGARFDAGDYTLRPMGPGAQLGAGRGSNTSRSRPKHKQKMRKPYHVVSGVRARPPAASRG